jgi:hypothetical protein
MTTTMHTRRTDEEFGRLIAAYGLRGYQLMFRDENNAFMVKPHRINHVLHLLLTLVTFGLWAPIWLLLAIQAKDERVVLTRDMPAELYLTDREAQMLGLE